MNIKRIALIGASLIIVAASACNKDDDNGPVGGTGGSATLRVNTFHHTRRIDSITVYIKYNAQDQPANGKYDDSARVVKGASDTVAIFSGLKAGKYYLYGNGWDPMINQAVHGGIPYTITSETTLSVNLPVTEDDGHEPIGGKGGNATLRVNTFHHLRRIDSIMVYIKYNTLDVPPNGVYDDSARVVKSAADTVAVFPGLKAGKYYLYGNGWDPVINQGVHGGIPYTITSETSQYMNLPVSEE